MFTLFKRFIREEDGQDFAEYALILGAIGVVAIAVIARYRNELIAAFEAGIEAPAQPGQHGVAKPPHQHIEALRRQPGELGEQAPVGVEPVEAKARLAHP